MLSLSTTNYQPKGIEQPPSVGSPEDAFTIADRYSPLYYE